ncbi:MAG: VTT domain-containing protein, partial [Deltaproteobacteria bacterium]
VYYPIVPDLSDRQINVHAKLMIVDDRLLRAGSANLSNRSMGLDSECDLAIEAGGDAGIGAAVECVRNELLAEHLGVAAERLAEAVAAKQSLVAAVEALRGGPRTLEPLSIEEPQWLAEAVPEAPVFDPEQPIDVEYLLQSFLPDERTEPAQPRGGRLAIGAVLLAALFAVSLWNPFGDRLTPETLAELTAPVLASPMAPLVAAGAIAVGTCLMVPVIAMIVAAGLVFGWLTGFAIALVGALVGAAAGYAIGRLLWRDAIRRLAGGRLNRISRAMAQRGVVSIALVRLVPLAPFTVVNFVAGASHIRLGDYLLGTLLAMAPGILALTYLAQSAERAIREPGGSTALTVLAIAALVWWVSRQLRRRLEDASTGRPSAPERPSR